MKESLNILEISKLKLHQVWVNDLANHHVGFIFDGSAMVGFKILNFQFHKFL